MTGDVMTATMPDFASIEAPRSNGELVFDAPWQGRIFGLVVHLCEAGLFEWDDFKAHLIAEIGESGEDEVTCDPAVYYRQFSAAFIALMGERGLLDVETLEERTIAELQRQTHEDHDHPHPH